MVLQKNELYLLDGCNIYSVNQEEKYREEFSNAIIS